jgi:hypothetical protein
VKFLVVYPLPWNLQTSATFQNIPGIPITSTNPTPNAQVRASLGRDLASCRGAATCTANVNLELLDPAANYESILSMNAGYGTNWLVPYEIMGGRLFKFSGQIEF